jgi:pyridoxal 5'-phosphate synthase pdxT subunit
VSAPRIGVLALQGDVREHVAALEAAGADVALVRRPTELAELDGIVLPGGESTTIGKLAVTFGLLEPLRDAIADGLPAYGSCAGMILLADRLQDGIPGQPTIGGLDMCVRRNAFGRQVDSFEGPVTIEGISGPPLHGVFIRAPWVESVGPDVEVLGRVHAGPSDPPDGRIVAVRHGHLLATSFHPELTGDGRVHELFVGLVKERS